MKIKEAEKLALENLCLYDFRNPDKVYIEDDEIIPRRKNCYCDNCFQGKDRLALALLEILERHKKIIKNKRLKDRKNNKK